MYQEFPLPNVIYFNQAPSIDASMTIIISIARKTEGTYQIHITNAYFKYGLSLFVYRQFLLISPSFPVNTPRFPILLIDSANDRRKSSNPSANS